MEKIYTKQDAREKMEKSVKYYKVRIEAWENVKRIYKKNGEPFAILSKNFENARFTAWLNSPVIEVTFRDETGRNTTEHITLTANAYKNEPEATTPEQVQNRINELIANYKKWLEIDTAGASQIEKQIDDIMPELDKLAEAIKQAKETNTHYTLQNYIKNYLHILND